MATYMIVSVNGADVLMLNRGLPLNTAVIVCDPTLSVDIVNAALPPDSVCAPNSVIPSKKLTVPAGVPEPGDVGTTVAVKVTTVPALAVDGLPASNVVVAALVTVTPIADDVLPP